MQHVLNKNGNSAWHKRHKGGHFNGKLAPLGTFVGFRPPKTSLTTLGKHDQQSMKGIFLCYYVHLGGRWKHEYLVAHLVDFDKPKTRPAKGLPATGRCSNTFWLYPEILPAGYPAHFPELPHLYPARTPQATRKHMFQHLLLPCQLRCFRMIPRSAWHFDIREKTSQHMHHVGHIR